MQARTHNTSMYIFVGLRINVLQVLEHALAERLSVNPNETWGLLINETGLLSSKDLSHVEWREVFGCACCTQGNSPIVRTSIISLLKSKPNKLLLILSTNSEPDKLLPMINQYFYRVAPLYQVIMCTNEDAHHHEMMNNEAYRSQFELADTVFGLKQPDQQIPSKRRYSLDWTSFTDIEKESLLVSSLPHGYHGKEDWSPVSGSPLYRWSSHLTSDANTYSMALVWIAPENITFMVSEMEDMIKVVVSQISESSLPLLLSKQVTVNACCVLRSNMGGWLLHTAISQRKHTNGIAKEFDYTASHGSAYTHRGYSRVEVEVVWEEVEDTIEEACNNIAMRGLGEELVERQLIAHMNVPLS